MGSKLFNIISWSAFYILLVVYYSLYSYDKVPASGFAVATIVLACVYTAAYVINRFLLPRLLSRKNFLIFLLLAVGVTALASFAVYELVWLWYIAIDSLDEDGIRVYHLFSYQFFCNYFVVFVGCITSIVYTTVSDNISAQLRYERLEKEKAGVELNFLKAQVNPHFIFNSLNTVYACVDKKNADARDVILKFSDVLRYQLYECNTERIDISKEVTYLEQYISLQTLRNNEKLRVCFNVAGDVKNIRVAPLLLSPFIENAFKYVSNTREKENYIKIQLSYSGDEFTFSCVNTRDRVCANKDFKNGGIGIENVRRRLELMYPGKYNLQIEDHEQVFQVMLKLYPL